MERLAVDLARRQAADGHKAFIYCTRRAGQLASQAELRGGSIHSFGKTNGPSLSLVVRLACKLREHRIDVLHAHNALVLHYGVLAARLAGVPVVVNTRHGGNLNWDPKCERIWRLATRFADGVVFVSEAARALYVKRDHLALNNMEVIYNGIDVVKFSSRKARPLRSLPRVRFGAVGRLVPAKDHITLVRAFGTVAGTLPGSELHLLGEGPCRELIEKTITELGLNDRVVLHGAGNDVAGFLSSLDVFVLSSLDEGLPICMMEAMAAGLPIISTRLPGLAELFPEHMLAGYCAPGQPELLANLMLGTIRRSDLVELGMRAEQWSQRFSIEESWIRYHSLFQEALAKKVLNTSGSRRSPSKRSSA